MKKAFISFRIGVGQWMPESRFQELLVILEKYKGVTDEITFFTSETHAPLPLETIEKRSSLLTGRMQKVREIGYRTGINILATIGKNSENLANSLSGNYTCMKDIEGNTCPGSFCPNGERVRIYIEQLYKLAVRANPDYIWIDDDVRLRGHGSIAWACFCDRCLSIFAEKSGMKYGQKTLKRAFNTGPVTKKLELRIAWLEHNRNTISRLFEIIERAVHSVNPGLPLGFMTGDRSFEGYDFDRWVEVLAGPGGREVMWRPGGGFYSDECLAGLTDKAHHIGRQVSLLPKNLDALAKLNSGNFVISI